ncbi:MAG TPA: hypothetical protein VGM23_08650, partial [Armatimonadota bacterium]
MRTTQLPVMSFLAGLLLCCLCCVAGMARAADVPVSGMSFWLKADALTGVRDGAPVAAWPDSSAGNHPALQTNAERQPKWIANGLNGKPVVRFDGDYLDTISGAALPPAHTIFAVVNDNSATDNGPFLWFENDNNTPGNLSDDPAGPAFGTSVNGGRLRLRNYPGFQDRDLPFAKGTPAVYTLLAETSGVTGYANGRSLKFNLQNGWTGAFANGATTGRFRIGMHGGTFEQFFGGDIAELIVYSRALSTGERRQVESYLAGKYGIDTEAGKAKPAILCIGNGGSSWPIAKKLAKDYGFNFGVCDFGAVDWEMLSQFNAVLLFDMSRLNPDTREVNAVEINPAAFQRVSELLTRFVREGGGLYIYGVSFTHMGQGWANETLNQFLLPLGAQIPFEKLQDPPKEKRQEGGQGVLYALADQIVPHPATANVKNLWYAVGPFSYGPWTRPLKLGTEWTPLIRTSPAFKATPIDPDKGYDTPRAGAASAITDKQAVIYAVRPFGKGRIVLSGGESTISFFGYAYSEYADKSWGRIGMEAGLNG